MDTSKGKVDDNLLSKISEQINSTGVRVTGDVNQHTTNVTDNLLSKISQQIDNTGIGITKDVNEHTDALCKNLGTGISTRFDNTDLNIANMNENIEGDYKSSKIREYINMGLTGLALLGLGVVGWNQFRMNKTLTGIDTMINSEDHGLIPITRIVNNTNKALADETNGLAAVKKDVLASNNTLADTFKGETSKQLEEQKKLVSQYSKQAKKTNQLLNKQKTALMDQTHKVMLEIGTSHRLLDDKLNKQTVQLNTAINPPKPNLIKEGPMQLNLYPFNKMDTVTFQDATFYVNGTEKVYPTAMKGRLEEILGHTGPNDRVSADESILLFTGNDKSMPAQMYSLAVGNSLSDKLNKDNILDMGIQLSLKRLEAEAIEDNRLDMYTAKVARKVGTYDMVQGGFSQAISTIVKLVKNDSITDDMYRNNPELFDQMKDIRGEAQKVLTQENLTPNDLMNVFNDMYKGFKEVLDPTVSLKARNMTKPVGALYDPVNNQYLSLEGNKLKVYSKNNGDMFV